MFERNPKVKNISRRGLPPHLKATLLFAAVYFYVVLPAISSKDRKDTC
jgi:hypothetical protein